MEAIDQQLAQSLLEIYAHKVSEHRSTVQEKVLEAGEYLLRQGECDQQVFLLLDGSVKVFHTTLKGSEYLMALVGPGELFGEVEILTGEPQLCSVQALWQSRVAALPKNLYLQWFKEDTKFALLVHQVLCARLHKTGTRAVQHLSYPLEYSVLNLFRQLAEERSSTLLEISKAEIANYLGTNTRSINRIIHKLKEQKVVETQKKHIEICSISLLEKIMESFES